ncbi:hypothetical protein, partial [Nocardioides sp.]|uniref:hypothetical protein n=1 Tax=Nocardioides sp. TaxID=35761 RepID=UPI00197E6D07
MAAESENAGGCLVAVVRDTRVPDRSDLADAEIITWLDDTPATHSTCPMLHIGIGAVHRRTQVYKLVDGLHVRIVNAATGELIRDGPSTHPQLPATRP